MESERERSQFESHSFLSLHTMDHYKVLGLNRSATKDEIKEAFRKLAMKFHPDKHSQSSKSVRESATVKFKQVSEAYDVLIDDRKRADYNLRSGFGSRGSGSGFSGGYRYGYYSGSSYRPRYQSGSAANGDGWVSSFDIFFQYLRTRAFLLNLAFASALLGGAFVINMGRDALWKMNNSGKSFEEAIESIQKAKANKDKM